MKKDPYAPLRPQMTEAPAYWRSLEHKSGDASLASAQEAEFPAGITLPGGFNRRDTLKLAGASLALGALTGCDIARRPQEEILPFVKMPEQVIPGIRLRYATAMQRSEGAIGLVVEAHEGRPTKIEGNPNHPSSLGGSDIWAQAEVLKLYDPQRARSPKKAGQPATWAEWDAFAKTLADGAAAAQGKGLAFLVDVMNGPTVERLLKAALAKFPQAKVYRHDALAPTRALEGAEMAFGPGARARYDFEAAKVIFSLDDDFLGSGPGSLKLSRQFGLSRAVHTKDDVAKMKRLYAAEGVFSTTGANADHRLRIASGQGVDVLKALGKALAGAGVDVGALASGLEGGAALDANAQKFVAALAKDLAANKGAAVILVGERQPAAVHAAALVLNKALGAFDTGLVSVSVEADAPAREGLGALAKALNEGAVETLFILDQNPAYAAPGALKFGEALAKAKTVIHAGVLPEETGEKATWHLPLAHFLESWGDARAWNGTVSLVQPLILPLFGARAATTLLAQLAGEAETDEKKLVEATWRGAGQPLENLKAWRKALHDGVVPNTAWAAAAPELKAAEVATALGALKGAAPSKDAVEVVGLFGHVKDGRLGNVSWLQELPDSMSKLCWDNAVLVSPTLARELGIESGVKRNSYTADVVTATVDGRSITAPAFVLPGLATYTAAIHLGYGRQWGDVAKGVGVDAWPLFADGTVAQGVKLQRTGATQELCSTQDHFSVPANPLKEMTFAQMSGEADAKKRELALYDRPIFMSGTAKEYVTNPAELVKPAEMPENLVQLGTPKNRPSRPLQPINEVTYEGQQWGMVIDLSACTGCNVCAIACQAENNIPTVGRDQVLLGRELHWIRVDRYYTGDVDQPAALHQPVPCMHCENAPCEPVCPVSATTHDEEGLNSMAYNRCIGTRYCSNNCPYKVRRFNYLDFSVTGDVWRDPVKNERMMTLKLQRNPDVTVRYRGVMEKCTYCTQRIEEAKVAAKRAGKDRKALPDGAVTPACAQACPTQAITFGNINDLESKVAKLKMSERNYEMLQELNVRPRTTYLARVRNANEELA
ncbi:MAG: TAT-variant-translocated molybdopterin oxidoreductase [Myxococcota bacterium]